jgi:hypothetical protein
MQSVKADVAPRRAAEPQYCSPLLTAPNLTLLPQGDEGHRRKNNGLSARETGVVIFAPLTAKADGKMAATLS